jgi:anti-anti-sigma regulatory factor
VLSLCSDRRIAAGGDTAVATLKITRNLQPGGRLELALAGRVTQTHVPLLQEVCDEARDLAVSLDLSGVIFVDAAGVRALIALERAGAAIQGCSGLVHELLEEGRS